MGTVIHIQPYLGDDTTGSVPDHHNKAGIAIKQVIIFILVGRSCLQFVKKKKGGKRNKTKCKKQGMLVTFRIPGAGRGSLTHRCTQ